MNQTVLKQITELNNMTFDQLKDRWRIMFPGEPPRFNRNFMIKRLAYRIQEIHFGGLTEFAKAKMKNILKENGYNELGIKSKSSQSYLSKGIPVVGTRIIRIWHDERYEVIVTNDGFEFNGKIYRSLSKIARLITGTRWNGLVFFGLRKNGKSIK